MQIRITQGLFAYNNFLQVFKRRTYNKSFPLLSIIFYIQAYFLSILFLFYWHFLVFGPELLPQFWPQGLEIFSTEFQWYEDGPQERIFGSHPCSGLQAQKGVSRVGLEALLLTLDHPLLNTTYQEQNKGSYIVYIYGFRSDPHSQLLAQKGVLRVGLESLLLTLYRASLAKHMLLQLSGSNLQATSLLIPSTVLKLQT